MAFLAVRNDKVVFVIPNSKIRLFKHIKKSLHRFDEFVIFVDIWSQITLSLFLWDFTSLKKLPKDMWFKVINYILILCNSCLKWILRIKVLGYYLVERLHACNFIKKRPWHRYFPVNFEKSLRTPFSQNTSGRRLLSILGEPQTLSQFNERWRKKPG